MSQILQHFFLVLEKVEFQHLAGPEIGLFLVTTVLQVTLRDRFGQQNKNLTLNVVRIINIL